MKRINQTAGKVWEEVLFFHVAVFSQEGARIVSRKLETPLTYLGNPTLQSCHEYALCSPCWAVFSIYFLWYVVDVNVY